MEKKLFSFDYEFYKNTYTDLERDNIISKEDCLAHYLRFGKKEGRSCSKDEIQIKYKKNKQEAINKIDNYVCNLNHFFNILIRTSSRPSYFENCIQSILSQSYENYHVYVCYDNEDSLPYLEKYKDHEKITYFHVNIESDKKYKFNLYCNILLERVQDGYIMFLDDDDIFIHQNALELLNKKTEENKLVTWKFLRPDKLIFKKDIEKPLILGEIDTACVCFHIDLKTSSSWNDQQYGDFSFYGPLFEICKNKEKTYIDFTLTSTQFDDKIGNYGDSENI